MFIQDNNQFKYLKLISLKSVSFARLKLNSSKLCVFGAILAASANVEAQVYSLTDRQYTDDDGFYQISYGGSANKTSLYESLNGGSSVLIEKPSTTNIHTTNLNAKSNGVYKYHTLTSVCTTVVGRPGEPGRPVCSNNQIQGPTISVKSPVPVVSLTSPASNIEIHVGTTYTLKASASVAKGSIVKAAFYVNGSVVANDTAAPFQYNWTPTSGTYTVKVVAEDSNGDITTSSSRTVAVTVNKPPSVGLTSPTSNQSSYRGTGITLAASASDTDGRVTKVAFYANGSLVSSDSTSPFGITWRPTALGNYTLYAVATDEDGRQTTSTTRRYTILNNAPSVTITSPGNGGEIEGNTPVSLKANASDLDGSISSVEFRINDFLLNRDTKAPYEFSWTPTIIGTYTLKVLATDNDGAQKTSSSHTLNVNTLAGVNLNADWASIEPANPADSPMIEKGSQHDPTVGAVAGEGGVSGGQASYHFPIELVPGRAGMQPNISVNYSSQGGNGILGMGFSVSGASAISRCARTVAHDGRIGGVQYSETNDRLCLDGQRLLAVSGAYGASGTQYRTEMDNFARITQTGALNGSSTSFTVEQKNGHIAYYGNSSDSRVVPPGAPATLTWLLKQTQDRTISQNSIRYHYTNFGRGEVRLANIYYTGSGDADGNRRVQYVYETRPDFSSSYLAGGETAQTKRLDKIRTFVGSQTVREYRFDYRASNASERSLLTSAQECGFSGSSAVCKPKTDMQWHDSAPKFELEKVGYRDSNGNIVPQIQDERLIEKIMPKGDANGDGVQDWPTWYTDAEGNFSGTKSDDLETCFHSPLAQGMRCSQVDINQDGKTDNLRASKNSFQVSYSGTTRWIDTGIAYSDFTHTISNIADYNGDGWPDIVLEESTFNSAQLARVELKLFTHTGNLALPYSNNGTVIYNHPLLLDRRKSTSVSHLGDMDGDGLPDLVISNNKMEVSPGEYFSSDQPLPSSLYLTRVNTRGVISFETVSLNPYNLDGASFDGYEFQYMSDINGDGLADWLAWDSDRNLVLSVNKGSGKFAPWQTVENSSKIISVRYYRYYLGAIDEWVIAVYPRFARGFRQTDINADGKPELLIPSSILASSCIVHQAYDSTVRIEETICGHDLYSSYIDSHSLPGSQLSLVDSSNDRSVYEYQSLSFIENADGSYRAELSDTDIVGVPTESNAVDAFGNGLSDLVFSYGCKNNIVAEHCYYDSVTGVMRGLDNGVYINRNLGSSDDVDGYRPQDMLVSVESATGLQDSWDYRPLSSRDEQFHSSNQPFYTPDFEYLDGLSDAAQQAHFHFSSSMYVVAAHHQSNGLGDAKNTTHYRYAGAMFNREGRGFQGFRAVIEENLAAGLRTQSDFHQVFPLAGKLYKQRTWTLSEASNDDSFEQTSAITEDTTTWQFWPSTNKGGGYDETAEAPGDIWSVAANQPYFVGPETQSSITRKLLASDRDELYQRSESTVFDGWGNPTLITSGYSEPNSQHLIVNTVERDYDNTTLSWWLGRLTEETVIKNPVGSRLGVSIATNSDKTHTITTQYSNWDSNARKPKTIVSNPSTGKSSTVTAVYNDYGLVSSQALSSAGEVSRTTLTGYTSDGYFAKTQTNALNHVVESDTDARFGVPIWVDDANDQRESFTYDAFGRLTSAHSVGRAPRAFTSLQWCNGCGVNDAVIIQISEQSGSPSQVAYLDKLGRTLRSETEAFADNEKLVQVIVFNALGQTTFESVPEYDAVGDLGVRYQSYDVLGRLTAKQADQTDGQTLDTTYVYEQGSRGFTTDINAGGLEMSRSYNGLNQLIETADALGGVTRYAYDGAGNPIVMQDANVQSITANFNALGQKEWVDDPNMGLKQFTYTGFGEVRSETDANTQTLAYAYDILGRLKTRHLGSSLESQWSYDPTNGLGFVGSESRAGLASGQSYSKTYQYDSLSRPKGQTTVIDGESFAIQTQYDNGYGRPKALQYPNGLTLAYGYNDRGYPTSVSNAATGYVYRTIESMDKSGQWNSATSADGVLSTNRYFDEATSQNRAIYFNNILDELHATDYEAFDHFGNLKEIVTSDFNGLTENETLVYDDLHRLKLNERSNGATINYNYDAVGNITKKDDYASVYNYTGTKPNAVSSVSLKSGGSLSFGYDNNGNRTHENGARIISYNAFNKPTNITRRGANIDFYYGADIMRYKQVNKTSGRTTLYVDKLFEKITKAGKTQYRYFIEDIAVLTQSVNSSRDSFEIGFTHRDRLGSTVAIADHNGLLKETLSFDPFGKPRLGSGADKPSPILGSAYTTRGFTDHEHLDDVQLIHMNGRGYDYNLGSFLSVDPYIQSPTNSQSLNPYSYIMNNPLSGTDPTGYVSTGTRIKNHEVPFLSVAFDAGGGGNGSSNQQNKDNGSSQNQASPTNIGAQQNRPQNTDQGNQQANLQSGSSGEAAQQGSGFTDSVKGFAKGIAQDFLDSQAQGLAESMGIQNIEDIQSSIQFSISESEAHGVELGQSISDGVGVVSSTVVMLANLRTLDVEPSTDLIRGSISLLVNDGAIDLSSLQSYIPEKMRNSFGPTGRVPAGQKYKFKIGDTKVLIKWHSPDLKMRSTNHRSNSGRVWTTQIKVGNKYLMTNGSWTRKQKSNRTHIPLIRKK